MKKFTYFLISSLLVLTGVNIVSNVSRAIASSQANVTNYVYETNFEGIVVNESNPPDNSTGFVWAQEYKLCKTETHDGSNMLFMTALNSDNNYTSIGGFGIGSKGNLGRCKFGESYQVDLYLDFTGMTFLEVEYVGGTDKWGACKIYGEDDVRNDNGGNNMVDLSYRNKHLTFKYTFSFNEDAQQNGWIQFKAFNASNAKVWMDDITIGRSEYAMVGTMDEYLPGEIDVNDSFGKKTIFYKEFSSLDSQIINENGNNKMKFSYQSDDSDEGKILFYFNKLHFLNKGREYRFTFNIESENVNALIFYLGGTWINDPSYVRVNLSDNTTAIFGSEIKSATYSNKSMTLMFIAPNDEAKYGQDWAQFQVIAETKTNSPISIKVDNTSFKMTPIIEKLVLDTQKATTTFAFGSNFTYEGIKIHAIYTDDSQEEIDPKMCSFTGYNMESQGRQTITVTYKNVTSTYIITVVRIPEELIIDTTNVKVNYGYGEEFDSTGLIVKVKYEDDGEIDILNHDTLTGGYALCLGEFDSHKCGTYTIGVIYKALVKTFTVTVSFTQTVDFTDIIFDKVGESK